MPPGKRWREGEIVGAFPNWDPIRRYGVPAPMRGASGAIKAFALYAGQPVGLIRNAASGGVGRARTGPGVRLFGATEDAWSRKTLPWQPPSSLTLH